MSLSKKRSSSVELSQQQSLLQQKLSAVDKHIRRSENLPATLFMHPQLLQHILKQPVIHQVNNQITIKNIKSFLFNERDVVKFYFIFASITPDRRYVLRVQPSHTQLEVYVQLDGRRKLCYLVDKSRGILIQENDWKRAQFTVIAKVKQKLSTAKFQMDTIIVDHKVKIHGIPSQRKIIEKQMDQYLKKNSTKQRIAQILEKRRRKSQIFSRNSSRAKTSAGYSTAKAIDLHQTSRIFRSSSGFNQSTSLIRSTSAVIKQPKIQQTQRKRDLRQFQDSKNKYLKHILKMDRQKAEQLNKYRKNYEIQKQQTLQQTSSTTIAIIFMHRMLKQSIKITKKKIKETHINILCRKFIKNLMHANKIRLANKNRNKVSMDLNLSAIGSILFKQSHKKAEARVIQRLKVNLFMLDIQKAAVKCQKYIEEVIKIQRRFRKADLRYRLRFIILSEYIKGYKCKDQKDWEEFFKKYKKYCYTKSKKLKFGFTKYHKQIDEIMKDCKTQN